MKSLKYLFTCLVFLIVTSTAFTQGAPPPPNNHNQSGNQEPGGNAPLGEGVFILFSLGVAYAGRKTYLLRKRDLK